MSEPRRKRLFVLLGVVAGVALVVIGVALWVLLRPGGSAVVKARYEGALWMPEHPFVTGVLTGDGVCDVEALKVRLAEDPAVAQTWAGIAGVEVGGIDAYLDGLTATTLSVDTQVTNHDYERASGAVELQSVLAKQTPVLVDGRGVPVVRCPCGNPLKPAKERATEVYGDVPSGFSLRAVVLAGHSEGQTDDPSTDAAGDRATNSPGPAVRGEPAGTTCGNVTNASGVTLNVVLDSGDVGCDAAMAFASGLVEWGAQQSASGAYVDLGGSTVNDGWYCRWSSGPGDPIVCTDPAGRGRVRLEGSAP